MLGPHPAVQIASRAADRYLVFIEDLLVPSMGKQNARLGTGPNQAQVEGLARFRPDGSSRAAGHRCVRTLRLAHEHAEAGGGS
jgi:hypothetical protein